VTDQAKGPVTDRITVLLADDHALVRRGFRRLLEDDDELAVVGEASNGEEAIALAASLAPHVIVMDCAMPGTSGLAAIKVILEQRPSARILMLSMHSEETLVRQAMASGARGYVLKNSAGEELIEAIQTVLRGMAFFSPAVARIFQDGVARLQDARKTTDRYESLTDRERQIYQLLAEGNSNKDIANRLNLSLHTVETHRWRIMEKMDLHGTAELVLSAVRRGLVT